MTQPFCAGFGGQHENHIIRIRELALNLHISKEPRQFIAGIAVGFGINGQLCGFIAQKMISKMAQSFLASYRIVNDPFQPLLIVLRKNVVYRVQRLKNQIRGAGGTEQRQGVLCLRLKRGGGVQVSAAGEHRQCFVRRVAAEIRPKIHRMQGLRKKFQVSAVGVVHSQQAAVLMGDSGESGNIQHIA